MTKQQPLSLSLSLSREVSRSQGTHEPCNVEREQRRPSIKRSSNVSNAQIYSTYVPQVFERYYTKAAGNFVSRSRHEEETRPADKSYRAALVFIDRPAAAGKSKRITPRRPFY